MAPWASCLQLSFPLSPTQPKSILSTVGRSSSQFQVKLAFLLKYGLSLIHFINYSAQSASRGQKQLEGTLLHADSQALPNPTMQEGQPDTKVVCTPMFKTQ